METQLRRQRKDMESTPNLPGQISPVDHPYYKVVFVKGKGEILEITIFILSTQNMNIGLYWRNNDYWIIQIHLIKKGLYCTGSYGVSSRSSVHDDQNWNLQMTTRKIY